MGYNPQAIRKGNRAELLAQSYWLSEGYDILLPYGHDSHYDFVATNGSAFLRIQVKSAILVTYKEGNPSLWRVRNKRGKNGKYPEKAYDYLHAVRGEDHTHWVIPESVVRNIEAITLERDDGQPLRSNSTFGFMKDYKRVDI